MQFGHLEEAGGTIAKIDWTDLKLSDFEKEDTVLTNHKIAFTGFYSDINRQYKPRARCARCTSYAYEDASSRLREPFTRRYLLIFQRPGNGTTPLSIIRRAMRQPVTTASHGVGLVRLVTCGYN